MENCTGEPTFQENHLEIIEMNSQTNHSFLNDALECFSKLGLKKLSHIGGFMMKKGVKFLRVFFTF